MSTLADLKIIAAAIKNETTVGANTASKVGALLESFIDNAIILLASVNSLNNVVFSAPKNISIATGDDYDLTTNDRYINFSAADDHTPVNLMDCMANVGQIHTIINSGSDTIDITPLGGDKINNSTAIRVLGPSTAMSLISFGSTWLII
ncbi:MAG TPA: hypothetical protein PKH58_13100 [Paludibacteraceae bacterium]|nr:hypothetical protein [Paludibacteraceae bacterium]